MTVISKTVERMPKLFGKINQPPYHAKEDPQHFQKPQDNTSPKRERVAC